MKVAALFVDGEGPYMEDGRFDAWPLDRDARSYAGGLPVVAHPPCNRWSKAINSHPEIPVGEDAGCFHVALGAVRFYGGVLEHPSESRAWAWFGLPMPPPRSWSVADRYGGRSCRLDQANYGHEIRKPTWLYAVLPVFPKVNNAPATDGQDFQSTSSTDRRRWLTPAGFKDFLFQMAESCVGWTPARGPRQARLLEPRRDVEVPDE